MQPQGRSPAVRPTLSLSTSTALALLLSACSDCGGTTGTSQGVLSVRPATVDFGKVRVGETKRREILLTNDGTGTLAITDVTRDGLPDSVTITGVPQLIEPGASVGVPVIWNPQVAETLAGTLTFVTDSAIQLTVTVDVKGRGLLGKLTVDPLLVDFGIAEVGKPVSIDVNVTNDGELEEQVLIQPGNDSLQFTVDFPQGDTLQLAPTDAGRFTVTYNPVRISPEGAFDTSRVELIPCDGCTGLVVELKGRAVDSFVDVLPADCLEFGLVNPGSSDTKPVRIGNRGTRALQVSAASTPASSGFTVAATLPATLTQDGTTTINVTFTPTELRRYQSTLRIETDDTSRPIIDLCVRGSGGGPDIQVTPPALNFGLTAVGIPKTRIVSISNVGLGTAAGSTLNVSALRFEGSGDFTADTTGPFTVVPGATRALQVTYAPATEADDTGTLVIVSDDVDASETRIPLNGSGRNLPPCELTVTPASGTLQFGNVSQGRTATLTARLTNAGSGDCLISDIGLSAATPTSFRLVEAVADTVLAPAQSLVLPIAFEPTRSGRSSGALQFAVSDPTTPSRSIALSAASEPGCLFIAPNELDFGVVGAGCSTRERVVTAYSTCAGTTVSLTSIQLADAANQPFVLVGLPAVPAPLTTGALSFRVRFNPQANGDYRGAILVQSNESGSLPYNVGLFGRAADDARQTDTFDQRARPAADVLFVIDNSGSMGDEQEALAQNFGGFMQYALGLDFDYHLAATTTDVAELGVFRESRGGIRIITPETPFPAENFSEIVNPGTNGSGDERGMECMEMALSPPSIDTENAGFLRDEAFLTVILISDEEDSSDNSVAYFEQFLLNVKGARSANLVSANAIANPGSRYEVLTTAFQGQFVDIGQTNWASALTSLGTAAFSFRTRFFLTASPGDVTQLEIRINGQVIPARQGAILQWRYDAAQNAVIFDPVAIPEPGDVLEISYPVACIR